jgi:hypothetical protein
LAINFDHRHARIKPFAQVWITIDIDNRRRDSELSEHFSRLFAKMATITRVEHHVQVSNRLHKTLFKRRF